MKKIRVSLTGVGGYGVVHYQYLRRFADEGLLDFCGAVILPECREREAEKIRELESLHIPIYPDNASLLRHDPPDLAILPVGIAVHRALCEEFLAADVSVLVEKPAAGCVADVDAMIRAESASRGIASVSFQDMYSPEVRAIKQRILQGDFGRLQKITMAGIWLRGDNYYARNNWAGRRSAANGTAIWDSPANNAFAHHLNLALFWAGGEMWAPAHPEMVQAELYRARPEIETFDVCAMRFVANHIPAVILMSHVGQDSMPPHIRLDFEEGSLVWIQEDQGRHWYFERDGVITEQHPDLLGSESIYRVMASVLNGGPEHFYTLQDARAHAEAIEAMTAFPIHPLLGAVRRETDGQYDLPGIGEIIRHCYRESALPGEVGAPWAVSAGVLKI